MSTRHNFLRPWSITEPRIELAILKKQQQTKQHWKNERLQIFIVWSTTLIETIKNNCTGKYEKKEKWDRRKKDFWRNLRWSELFPHPFSSLLVRLCISTTHWISSSIVIISRKKKRERELDYFNQPLQLNGNYYSQEVIISTHKKKNMDALHGRFNYSLWKSKNVFFPFFQDRLLQPSFLSLLFKM